jgi:hypothetical protein
MDDMSGYDRVNCPMNMDQTPMMGPMAGPMMGPMMGPMAGPMMNNPMMNPMTCPMMNNPMMNDPMTQMGARQLENLYPEIYKLTYPMVVRACDNLKYMGMQNSMITVNMIDEMVINIYDSINTDEERSDDGNDQRNEDDLRIMQRFDFRDLIRILLIRELLRRGHTHYYPMGYGGGYMQGFGRQY